MNTSPSKQALIQTSWDDDAHVWLATSFNILGLAIEANTIEELRQEIEYILPDLIELNGLNFSAMGYHLECSTPKMP
jgi:hypothetical protein